MWLFLGMFPGMPWRTQPYVTSNSTAPYVTPTSTVPYLRCPQALTDIHEAERSRLASSLDREKARLLTDTAHLHKEHSLSILKMEASWKTKAGSWSFFRFFCYQCGIYCFLCDTSHMTVRCVFYLFCSTFLNSFLPLISLYFLIFPLFHLIHLIFSLSSLSSHFSPPHLLICPHQIRSRSWRRRGTRRPWELLRRISLRSIGNFSLFFIVVVSFPFLLLYRAFFSNLSCYLQ